MSVINKVPLINTILSGLSEEQLSALRDCVNGQGGTPIFRSCKPLADVKLTAADKGIKPITLEIKDPIAAQQIYEGYLIYTDTGCWVISFANDGSQCLLILTINTTTLDVSIASDCCSVLELRSELDDVMTAGSGGGSGGGGESGGGGNFIEVTIDDNTTFEDLITSLNIDVDSISQWSSVNTYFILKGNVGALASYIPTITSIAKLSVGKYPMLQITLSGQKDHILWSTTTTNSATTLANATWDSTLLTRLYKHTMTINGSSYVLISADNIDLTGQDAGDSSFVPYAKDSIKFYNRSGRTILYFEYRGSGCRAYFGNYGSDTSMAEYEDFSSGTTVTDTVTPL